MIKRWSTAIASPCLSLVLVLAPAAVEAQSEFKTPTSPADGRLAPGVVIECLNSQGQAVPMTTGGCAGSLPVSVTGGGSSGASGTPTQVPVSIGTSSGTILAAAAASNFIKLCIAVTAANGIFVRWDGGTATQAAPSEYIPPGQCDSWVKASGFLPTSQINGIASSTVSATLIYN